MESDSERTKAEPARLDGLVNTTRTMRLANSRATINGKLRYAVNSVSFIPADTPLKVADFYNIQGVFTPGSMPDNPSGGPAYLQTAVMASNMRDYVEVVFENAENLVQSWHIDGYAFWVVGMDGGPWTPASRQSYNLRDAIARYTLQVCAVAEPADFRSPGKAYLQ